MSDRKNIYGPFNWELSNGDKVRGKLYAYNPAYKKESVIFKYGDLLNRAIRFKQGNSEIEVEIRFAIYKMAKKVYIGYVPGSVSYGWVGGTEKYGAFKEDEKVKSEKLIYSVFKAAEAGIKVEFVYHNPDDNGADDEIGKYLKEQLEGNTVASANLTYRKVSWPAGDTTGQQHNKFMTLSHIKADSDDGDALTSANGTPYYRNAVYVSTANVDKFGTEEDDWYKPDSSHRMFQNGATIYGHSALYQRYNTYFGLVCENYNNQTNFWNAVTASHCAKELNWIPTDANDPCEAYFFPIPNRIANAWDAEFNPLVKYVNKLIESSNGYLKINVYHLKTDAFGDKLIDILNDANLDNLNIKSVFKKNSAGDGKAVFPKYNGQNFGASTHAKNYMFALSDIRQYYSMIGSANAKADAFNSKANNILVFCERPAKGRAHPVYDVFKQPMFEDAYDS